MNIEPEYRRPCLVCEQSPRGICNTHSARNYGIDDPDGGEEARGYIRQELETSILRYKETDKWLSTHFQRDALRRPKATFIRFTSPDGQNQWWAFNCADPAFNPNATMINAWAVGRIHKLARHLDATAEWPVAPIGELADSLQAKVAEAIERETALQFDPMQHLGRQGHLVLTFRSVNGRPIGVEALSDFLRLDPVIQSLNMPIVYGDGSRFDALFPFLPSVARKSPGRHEYRHPELGVSMYEVTVTAAERLLIDTAAYLQKKCDAALGNAGVLIDPLGSVRGAFLPVPGVPRPGVSDYRCWQNPRLDLYTRLGERLSEAQSKEPEAEPRYFQRLFRKSDAEEVKKIRHLAKLDPQAAQRLARIRARPENVAERQRGLADAKRLDAKNVARDEKLEEREGRILWFNGLEKLVRKG
jgi:hypothetical protein